MRKCTLPVVLCCLLLAACHPATAVVAPTGAPQTAPVTPTITAPTLTAAPSSTPASTQAAAPERTHYRIDANLDEALRTLRVSEEIRFSNPTGAALELLPLVVEPNRSAGAFDLLSVSASNGGTIAVTSLESNLLTLRLQPALAAGASLVLTLDYALHLPPVQAGESQIFGYTQKQINLTDWYPALPAYSPDSGWLAHPPAAVGEHTAYPAADFDVDLHLPQSNPALVVAAAAPAALISDGYRYHLESARNFTWSASTEYRVATQQAGPVTVTSYAFPATELQARAALDYTVQAVNYFSELFGAPLHTSLSLVQADFPDGMEFDGLYFLSGRFYYGFDGSARSYLALIAVHETAHQWWYKRVGSDQANEPWLDEALCTYSELLFYEQLSPELADWWWRFRVEPYDPHGKIDRSIYDFSDFLSYRNTIYLRGAQFLHAVRQASGDAAFFSALRSYAGRYAGQIASGPELLKIFEESTQADLSSLEAEYFQP